MGGLAGCPACQLFEIHGSKFKPYPVGGLGQTAIERIVYPAPFAAVLKPVLFRCDTVFSDRLTERFSAFYRQIFVNSM